MAGRNAAVEMSQAELTAFLGSRRKVQVATLLADGSPHLTTLFYAMVDGRIAFWTYRRSQKAVNLRRDPRLTALVEEGESYDELRGAMIIGRADLVEDPPAVEQIALRISMTPDANRERIAAQARKRVAVRVTQVRVTSWDHRKLQG